MKLTAEQCRALKLLAGNPRGCTEAILLAHGFTVALLAKLVIDGLATVASEQVRASGRSIQVTRMQITDEGRRALA